MTDAGELMALCLLALAIGLDAFSVSLGLGLRKLVWSQVLKISMASGIFHIVMTLFGILTGHFITDVIGHFAVGIGGIILILFGVHMVYSSFLELEGAYWHQMTGVGILIFAAGVSLDSFSVGLSLGIFSVNTWLTVILFGVSGFVLTFGGIITGEKAGGWLGQYSVTIGGLILVALGLKILI